MLKQMLGDQPESGLSISVAPRRCESQSSWTKSAERPKHCKSSPFARVHKALTSACSQSGQIDDTKPPQGLQGWRCLDVTLTGRPRAHSMTAMWRCAADRRCSATAWTSSYAGRMAYVTTQMPDDADAGASYGLRGGSSSRRTSCWRNPLSESIFTARARAGGAERDRRSSDYRRITSTYGKHKSMSNGILLYDAERAESVRHELATG